MGELIKTYDELKRVCDEINTPWLNKYLKEFSHNVFWGLKVDHDLIPLAHDKLSRISKLLKKRGYDIDEMAIIKDTVRLWHSGED